MRRLLPRGDLQKAALVTLSKKTTEITSSPDLKSAAHRIYTSSRGTAWFTGSVVATLKSMAGLGERCMFCSGSEASQVEHFRPKAVFPALAMNWENFIWACGLCNQFKGNQFPNENRSVEIINPIDECVWNFFFIDEFGQLTPLWRDELDNYDPRAESTATVLALDREALQESRLYRLESLKTQATDSITLFNLGELSVDDLRQRVEMWRQEPVQQDVADYFLSGPGRDEQPFRDLLALIP